MLLTVSVFSLLHRNTKTGCKYPDHVAPTVDRFMSFYHSAVAHRCTLQAELCCLIVWELWLVCLIAPYTVSPPGDSWGLAYAGGEVSAHLRDQREVLRWPLSSVTLHPHSCMGKATGLQCLGDTVTRGLQRKAGQQSNALFPQVQNIWTTHSL